MRPRRQRQLYEGRFVRVDDLAKDPGLLDDYPHRYVYVGGSPFGPARAPAGGRLAQIFWSVETLEQRGWEPVAWDLSSHGAAWVGVVLRRVGPGPGGMLVPPE